jgi:hypothetical protein
MSLAALRSLTAVVLLVWAAGAAEAFARETQPNPEGGTAVLIHQEPPGGKPESRPGQPAEAQPGEPAARPRRELSAEEKARVAKLIAALASIDWQVRENASTELAKFGRRALPLLREAAKSADPEAAQRAQTLVDALDLSRSREISKNNLRQLGLACHMWADDHDGVFPPDLLKLVPAYADNAKILQCPWYTRHAADGVDYVYVSGLRATDAGFTVVAYEPLPGPDGKVYALYADAHAELVRFDELKKTLDEQVAARAKHKRETRRIEPKGVACDDEWDDEPAGAKRAIEASPPKVPPAPVPVRVLD